MTDTRDAPHHVVPTAVVTGVGHPVGHEVVRRLASAGMRIVGLDRVGRTGPQASVHETVAVDLCDPASIVEAAESVLEITARVDVLVHCAAAPVPTAFDAATLAGLDEAWKVNVRAPFLVTQALLTALGPGSSVVFVPSAAARAGTRGQSVLGPTSGAIEGLTRALAVELAEIGVRVNAVVPGLPLSPDLRSQADRPTRNEPDQTVDGVAAATVFFAGPDASFLSGVVLSIDECASFMDPRGRAPDPV